MTWPMLAGLLGAFMVGAAIAGPYSWFYGRREGMRKATEVFRAFEKVLK